MENQQAIAITKLGYDERAAGNIARARELYSQAAGLYRESHNPLPLAHTIRHIADMDRQTGDFAAAEPTYREALALYRANPDTLPLDLANTFNGFAKLLVAKGGHEEARLLTIEARDIYASLEIEPGVEECSRRLAKL